MVFGESEGLETVVQDPDTAVSTTPPHPPGPVAVSIRRPDGKTARLDEAFVFETPMAVTSVVPGAGPVSGGNAVSWLLET